MVKIYFEKKTRYNRGIARIPILGPISSARPSRFSLKYTHPDSVIEDLQVSEADDKIKAVLVSINSPGGHAVPSYEIAENISSLEKPSVALIRDIGASGAYLVASACDKIVAHEMSVVGGIGLTVSRFEFADVMKNLGVRYDIFRAGQYKDLGTPYRKMGDDEREILQNYVDTSYNRFAASIAQNRGWSEEKLKELAEEWIMHGKEAKDAGLVDELGDLQTARALCEELGDFKCDGIVERKLPLFQKIVLMLSDVMASVSYAHGFGMSDALFQQGFSDPRLF